MEQAKLHDAVKKQASFCACLKVIALRWNWLFAQATAEADALTKHHQSGDIKSSMQATRVDPPP